MEIVGIVGKKRHGKDVTAEAFVRQHGFVKIGFADALKEAALALDPIVDPDEIVGQHDRLSDLVERFGWESAKEWPEVRRLLQRLGTEVVRNTVNQDGWLMAWQKKVDELTHEPVGVVVPDVRFLNEAEFLRTQDARIIRVVRPSLFGSEDRHASEVEQEQIRTDLTIINDGTVEELQRRVLGAYYLGRTS